MQKAVHTSSRPQQMHNPSHRYMLGIAGIPSLIMLAGMLFMPESPHWLVFHKKGEKARRVLLRSRTSRKVEEEMEAIEKDYIVYKQNKMGEWTRSHAGHMQVTCRSHAGHMQYSVDVQS